jgi:ribosomal-protein-alanine N-acetyltransferase
VGCCGLRPYRPDEGISEVGTHILASRWGESYATEAQRSVMGHAYGPLRVQGLFARHNPGDHGSGHILETFGFHYTHDEFMPQTGLDHPCYLTRKSA